jgi:hypothetical protein
MEARWAESIVGLFDLERGTGSVWTAVELNAALAESLRGQGLPGFRPLDESELARTRSLRGELQRRWEALPPGGTLSVPFPTPDTEESSRSKGADAHAS